MLKINNDKLLEKTGLSFEIIEDLYLHILENIEWLESHNKNYNNKQYHKILELKDICNSIEVEL